MIKDKHTKIEHYLFVYGSLKKGFDNHIILKEANYISNAKTINKFAMYKEENKNYPYIVKNESIGHIIEGELYKITSENIWAKIDEFEGAPNYFKRINIRIKIKKREIKVKTYVLSNSKSPLNQKPLKSWVENSIKLNINFDDYYRYILG